MDNSSVELPLGKAIAGLVFFGLVVILVAGVFMAYVIVQPGTVGVVTHFGEVQGEVLYEGLHWKMPVKTKVIPMSTRVQKLTTKASASSKDLQIVTYEVVLNYKIDKAKAYKVYQSLGAGYRENIIEPAMEESVKSATARFTAEELITRRPEAKEVIFKDIKKRLRDNDIIVTDFSIVDFDFSKEFNRAITEKQVAEQRALRSANDLKRIKIEAQQAEATAKGQALAKLEKARAEAEAQKLLRLTLSTELLMLRAIEKWDGQLPVVVGESKGGAYLDILGILKQKKR